MAIKRWNGLRLAGSLAAVTFLCSAFPAYAQYQQDQYAQAQQPNPPYGAQSQYNGAPGQAQAYPQTYAPQQVPA
ncbi:MAG: hypothetical protein K2W95_18255, partial [Candidatus Obscuribacterales bacterium]|nr:hypothetical protein [Candidatus Obscuribacterales bacterium]